MYSLLLAFRSQASRRGIFLYALTLLIELIGVWPRYIIVKILLWPITVLTTGIALFRNVPLLEDRQLVAPATGGVLSVMAFLNSLIEPVARIIAWYPVVFGLLTVLVLPGGFLLTRWALGARKPSTREKALVNEVIADILKNNPAVRGPSAFYVIDNIEPNAYTIGTALYLHSGLLSELMESSYRYGVIAHHMGHRNSYDGRLELALRRLVIYPFYFLSRSVGTVAPGSFVYSIGRGDAKGCFAGMAVLFVSFFLALAGGGFGALILNPVWATYWRQREYDADAYAKQLGQDSALVEYLKKYTLQDVATPYHLNATPSNELRIDRLLHGPDALGTMPLPHPETAFLFSSVLGVCLLGFFWWGGLGAVGLGPQFERTTWILESFNYRNGVPTATEQCQLFFDEPTNRVEIDCFDNGYAYVREGHYTKLSSTQVVIQTVDNNPLPVYFGGAYITSFEGDRFIMQNTASGYTLTWKPLSQ